MKKTVLKIECYLIVFVLLCFVSTNSWSQPYRGHPENSSLGLYNNLDSKAKLGTNVSKNLYGWCLYDSQMPGYMGLIKFNTSNLTEVSKIEGNSQFPACAGCFIDDDLDGNGEYYVFGLNDGSGGMQPSLKNMMKVDLETGNSTQIAAYDNVMGMLNDAAYDYSTGTLYGVSGSGQNASIFSIDLVSGAFVQVATVPAPIFTMSITFDGDMYGIGLDANLYKINTNTWTINKIGSTGVYPMSLQSMTFDHTDNTLYWAFFNNGIGRLLTVDINTATATICGNIGGNTEIVGLHIPFTITNKQPRRVSDFTVTPEPNGIERATLSWVNPSTNIDDSDIQILSKVEVYRDEELIHTVANPIVGGSVTWQDIAVESGIHTYKVIAYSDVKGMAALKNMFIGRDVPNAVDNLKLTKDGANAILTWNKVNTGYNEGWIDVSSIKYKVIRMPDNVVLGEVSENSFIDNSITKMNLYTYLIESSNTDGIGGRAASNSVVIGPSFDVPSVFNFPTIEEFSIWTVKDNNNDGKTWGWNSFALDGSAASCQGGLAITNDDWMMSPPVKLEANKKYRISYGISAISMMSGEKLKVTIGRGTDVSSQTTVLGNYDDITNFENINYVVYFEAEEAGEYNLGFYSYTTDGYMVNVADVEVREYYEHDLMALELKGIKMPVVNFEYDYSFTYKNLGIDSEREYTIELINENGDLMKTVTEVPIINAGATDTILFKWMPLSIEDAKQLRCRVVMSGDNNDNNVSKAFDIDIQPEGSPDYVEIGSGSRPSGMPISPSNIYSGSQTLYLKEELKNMIGVIEKISYNVAYCNGIDYIDVEVYMANSDLRTLQVTGSVPKENFTLVYDGELRMSATDVPTKWEIELDNDFLYLGESLLIMVAAKSTKLFEMEFFTYEDWVINPFRTCAYFSNDQPFNYESQEVYLFNPQINIHLQRNGGASISGVVTDDKGAKVESADVFIEKVGAKAKTNALGEYSFPYLMSDSYNVLFSKFGYIAKTINDVNLTIDNSEAVINVELDKIPQHKITGKCVTMNNQPISNAEIRIKGYESYKATSNVDGSFAIENVFAVEDDYIVEVKAIGYLTYNSDFRLTNEDLVLDFKLSEVAYCPAPIVANVVANNVELRWDGIETITPLKHDDGIVSGQIGSATGDAYNVIGTTFRVPTVIHKLSWFITEVGGPHEKVNLFIFDLDEDGNPTTNIITSVENVDSRDNNWSSYIFEIPISCPNGFLFGMSYEGFIAIGLDSGATFVDNTHYTCFNYNIFGFEKFDAAMFSNNPMLRAEGMIVGSPVERVQSNITITKIQSESSTFTTSNCESFNTNLMYEENRGAHDTRSLVGYKVWRFMEKDIANIDKWTLLTENEISDSQYKDEEWSALADDEYRYGVRAIYSGDVESKVTMSDMIGKNMNAGVSISVITNTTINESEGAEVLLTNQNGMDQYQYSGMLDSDGALEITNVWKGVYDLRISLNGFEPLTAKNIDISKDVNTFSYTMNEIVITPYNLIVETVEINEDNNKVLLSWNNPYGIEDDFEKHIDFTINSKGELGWNYIDGDNARTTIMGPATYPNIGEKMAAIVFNPKSTNPSLEMPEIKAHSGNKYLGVFASEGIVNNDWIISPELNFEADFVMEFYARSLTDQYGKERIKIAYSTTGLKQSDFVNYVHNGDYVEVSSAGWRKHTYSFPRNAKYIAINCVSDNAFLLMIDDISIGIKKSNRKFVNYQVYIDGVRQAEITSSEFLFENIPLGKHTAGVKAVYSSKETKIIEKDFVVKPSHVDNYNDFNINIYPNPVKDYVNINGAYDRLEIYDALGRLIISYNDSINRIDMSSFETGCYIFRIYSGDNITNHKITK